MFITIVQGSFRALGIILSIVGFALIVLGGSKKISPLIEAGSGILTVGIILLAIFHFQ